MIRLRFSKDQQRSILAMHIADQEIDYLWTRPKSQSAYWFFLNRYFAFFGNLATTILGFSDLSAQVCLMLTLGAGQLHNDHPQFRGE